MSDDSEQQRAFPGTFDAEFAVGPDARHNAYVGRDVLRGLIAGIDGFIEDAAQQRTSRSIGPALIGAVNWINDTELIDSLAKLAAACIVVTKKGRERWDLKQLNALQEANARTPGFPIRAFPQLGWLGARIDDEPRVVGPYDQPEDIRLPTMRTLGFRPQGQSDRPPWIHTKLALLGDLWWDDEDALGFPEEVTGFTPHRLWVSSCNFTTASRSSLEFGFWTDDPPLLAGVRSFLVDLIGASEGLDGDDWLKPQFPPVEFDDEAMAEAAAGIDDEDEDEDEEY